MLVEIKVVESVVCSMKFCKFLMHKNTKILTKLKECKTLVTFKFRFQ